MTLNKLADLLKARNIDTVCYFHTDHFEPWTRIEDLDNSLRAIDHFAKQSAASRYGKRATLFYAPGFTYSLSDPTLSATHPDITHRLENDWLAFHEPIELTTKGHGEGMRALVTDGEHEIQVHLHHERWTRNTSHYANHVSEWVNANSTSEKDSQRIALATKLCLNIIHDEIGQELKQWSFVHGNWALNGANDKICTVENEVILLQDLGCVADFTFPAIDETCQPLMTAPFACQSEAKMRFFDQASSNPKPITFGSQTIKDERFIIWSALINPRHVSLDYVVGDDLEFFRQPQQAVYHWCQYSPVIDRTLFIKTHAHSLLPPYNIHQPTAVIPHCQPEIVSVFETLERVCDIAQVPLKLLTVNEVLGELKRIDQGLEDTTRFPVDSTTSFSKSPIQWDSDAFYSQVKATLSEWSQEQSDAQTELLNLAPYPLNPMVLSRQNMLQPWELALMHYFQSLKQAQRYRMTIVGAGNYTFALGLALMGYEVMGLESKPSLVNLGHQLKNKLSQQNQDIKQSAHIIHASFADTFISDLLSNQRINILIMLNSTNMSDELQREHSLRACLQYDEILFNPLEFQRLQTQDNSAAIFSQQISRYFEFLDKLYASPHREYWRCRPHSMLQSDNLAGKHIAESAPSKGHHTEPAMNTYELTGPFSHKGGFCWMARLPETFSQFADTNEAPFCSPLKLCEQGAEFGYPHTTHQLIGERGEGRFSHWGDYLLFSTSDNSDPNNEGRSYTVTWPASVSIS